MKRTRFLLISLISILFSIILSSMGYAASGDNLAPGAPGDIPADFYGIWLEVEYDPKETEIFPNSNGYILEIANIKIKAWYRYISNDGKAYVIPWTNYCPRIYIKDVGGISVYDGKYDATDLVSEKEGKRFGDDSRSWNGNKLQIGLASNYYKYARQKYAKIKITPKPDPNWLNYPPIKTNLDNLYEPRTLKIAQWVDYKAIVKRDGSFYSVWKIPPSPEFKKLYPDSCVKDDDTIICDGGADWFKWAVAYVFNDNKVICDKVTRVHITYLLKPYAGCTVSLTNSVIYSIADERIAKIIRLNLQSTSGYLYFNPRSRTGVIIHEATHAYQNWALKNKSKSGIIDRDGERLPIYDTYVEEFVWKWQYDHTGDNGFKGDTESDNPLYRPKAINIKIGTTQNSAHNWYFFKSLIQPHIPKKPVVGNGLVPLGKLWDGGATITFYWIDSTGREYSKIYNLIKLFKRDDATNAQDLASINQYVYCIEINYPIVTMVHPDEFDCEERAGAEYIFY